MKEVAGVVSGFALLAVLGQWVSAPSCRLAGAFGMGAVCLVWLAGLLAAAFGVEALMKTQRISPWVGWPAGIAFLFAWIGTLNAVMESVGRPNGCW